MESKTVDGEVENITILSEIYKFKDYDSARKSAQEIADKFNVSFQKVNGLLGTALTNTKTWESYRERFGFTEDQRPSWVGRGKEAAIEKKMGEQEASPKEEAPKEKPIKRVTVPTPGSVDEDAKKTNEGGSLAGSPAGTPTGSLVGSPGGSQGGSPLGDLGLSEGAYPVGSDARLKWMRDNAVTEMNGALWQRQKLPDGRVALIQVQIPDEVLMAERRQQEQSAEMLLRELPTETIAIAKKVIFDTKTFMYYEFAKARGLINEDDDLGDFCNSCVDLCMKKIFGATPQIVINRKNTLPDLIRRAQQPEEEEEPKEVYPI